MKTESKRGNPPVDNRYKLTGLILIIVGLFLGLDQILKTGWISFLVFPLCGLIMIVTGLYLGAFGWLVAGSLVLGLGCGGYFLLSSTIRMGMISRVGYALVFFGISWLLITLLSLVIRRPAAWWALVPGSVLIGAGLALTVDPLNLVDFVFCILCGLGLSFLAWGMANKLFGLIIPGSLLVGIGAGIYFGWRNLVDLNALAQSGVMLVWFAFGWGLITVLARRVYGKFIWWPLIPGGILAVAGWGLFIGGDPGNALGFIGNTGTIGILVFGLYLLLMRNGIHR